MRYVISIEADGDAFHPDPAVELAKILLGLSVDIGGTVGCMGGNLEWSLYDSNGNYVGYATVDADADGEG